ncbi:MAG: GNAT family N-acetyltransferase [Anaerolineaceae bacterium]
MNIKIVPATQLSHSEVITFLNADNLSFRHLDWLTPIDRISQPGCFALVSGQELRALLSCEPENPQTAWLRLFASFRDGNHARYFSLLLAEAQGYLRSLDIPNLYALALHGWLETLLKSVGFQVDNHIVTLMRRTESLPQCVFQPDIIIRLMTARDLGELQLVDQASFPPAWQLNPANLLKSYQASFHSTVALHQGQLIGYQITTSTFTTAHLARLAVLPKFQGYHIGEALLTEMLTDCLEQGISEITVNTQLNNNASLNLYQKFDFRSVDRPLPVYKNIL